MPRRILRSVFRQEKPECAPPTPLGQPGATPNTGDTTAAAPPSMTAERQPAGAVVGAVLSTWAYLDRDPVAGCQGRPGKAASSRVVKGARTGGRGQEPNRLPDRRPAPSWPWSPHNRQSAALELASEAPAPSGPPLVPSPLARLSGRLRAGRRSFGLVERWKRRPERATNTSKPSTRAREPNLISAGFQTNNEVELSSSQCAWGDRRQLDLSPVGCHRSPATRVRRWGMTSKRWRAMTGCGVVPDPAALEVR